MVASDLQADYGLEALLRALHEAGLRIGVVELARLKHVFDLAPRLNREPSASQLKTILRAVLVKDEAGQALFDRVCDAWLERADAVLVERPQHQGCAACSAKKLPVHAIRRNGFLALMVLVLVLVVPFYYPPIEFHQSVDWSPVSNG